MPQKIQKLCVECNEKGKLNSKLNKIICNECRNLDKYTLITKTFSKKEYLLKDDELAELNSIEANSSYGPATYYIKSDIINKACEKHNTDYNELNNTITKILEEKTKLKEINKIKKNKIKKIKQTKKKEELIVALNNAGLVLRNDSVLCEKYIENDTEYTLDEVVERMCQMKYLYEYCHMDECKNIAYKNQKEELRQGYYPDCTVAEQAEYIALKKYSNGKYPNVYPWQIV